MNWKYAAVLVGFAITLGIGTKAYAENDQTVVIGLGAGHKTHPSIATLPKRRPIYGEDDVVHIKFFLRRTPGSRYCLRHAEAY